MFRGFRKKDITRSLVAILLFCLFHHQFLAVATAFPSNVIGSEISANTAAPPEQTGSVTAGRAVFYPSEVSNLTSVAPEGLTLTELVDGLSTVAKLNKPRELTLLGLCLIAGGIGAAIGGGSYALNHLFWGGPWDWYDFAAACVTGAALMIASILLSLFGPAALAYVFDRTTEAGVAMVIEPIVSDFFRNAVSGITSAWDAMFGDVKGAIEANESQWETTFGPTIQSLVDASGGQHGQPEFDSRWVDFTEATVSAYGMSITGAGVEYNEYYGASWRFLYPGVSYMIFQFDFASAPAHAMLVINHLTSADESCPGGGYSPIDIYLNGYLLADNYDVAENHGGSHAYETDRWDIAGHLLSHNTLKIEFEDDPWACTHYWIQNLAILPGTSSGDNTPPTVVSQSVTSSTATNIYVEFNEDMNQGTLNNSNISVVGTVTESHSCSFSFNSGTYTLTIDPSTDFVYDEWVTVTIGTGVTDLAGNGLESPYSFSFKISSEEPEPTSITVTEVLQPSTVAAGGAVTVSGTAIYDTDDPVSNGTTIIRVAGVEWSAPISDGEYERQINAPNSSGNWLVYVDAYDGLGRTGSNSVTLVVQDADVSPHWDLDFISVCGYCEEDSDGDVLTSNCRSTFSPTEGGALWGVLRITDVSTPIRPEIGLYAPDGATIFFIDTLGWYGPADGHWDFAWWYWGYSDIPNFTQSGTYTYRWYLQHYGDSRKYVGSRSFVYRYEFVEHLMCKGIDGNYQPVSPTNNFSNQDVSAYTWMHLEYLSEDIGVRWVWKGPTGQVYRDFDDCNPISLCHHGGTFDPPYDDYFIWGNIDVNGYDPEYMCGDWTVEVYLTNAWGSWELKYIDNFRIEEPTPPSVVVSHVPEHPIETQSVSVSVSASDNNHLQRVVLRWNDGTDHSQELANGINNGSYNDTEPIGSFSGGQSVTYWAEVWDESGNRAESEHKTFVVQPEVVTTPSRPAGPVYLQANQAGQYTTGGSTTSLGNSVQYRFDWGDGSQSGWDGPCSTHSWPSDSTYLIKAQARSQTNPTRESQWSNSLPVIVDSKAPTVVITTNGGADTTVADSMLTISGQSGDDEPSSGLASAQINTGAANNGDPYTWSFDVLLAEGANQLIVTSLDNLGNEGSDTINVTYDDAGVDFVNIYNTGWNLMSLPLDPTSYDGNDPDNVIGDDATTYSLYGYSCIGHGYEIPSEIYGYGIGYWLLLLEDASIDVRGAECESPVCIDLCPGWSIIGDPFLTNVDWSQTEVEYDGVTMSLDDAVSQNLIYNLLYAWDGGGYQYAPTLDVGVGYWIPALADVRLCVYSQTGLFAAAPSTAATRDDGVRTVLVECGEAIVEIGLHASAYSDSPTRFDRPIPPLGPNVSGPELYLSSDEHGIFTSFERIIRPASDSAIWHLNISTSGDHELQFSRVSSLADQGYRLYLRESPYGQMHEIQQDQSVTVMGQVHELFAKCIDEALDGLPADFWLSANYPNPFNPNTVISFALPEACEVELSVYNVLGQKVRALARGSYAAGKYEATWNGRDYQNRPVSSGIYFYRLDAGSFGQTKKMMLMK